MMLLPPKEGSCPICATEHKPEMPHNQQSLYYQYRFYGIRGRWPTWADALAHCRDDVKLRLLDEWSEPEDGNPIADPPAESVHQVVDISAPGTDDCEARS